MPRLPGVGGGAGPPSAQQGEEQKGPAGLPNPASQSPARAVLAVGWDRRVVWYTVPLIGDLRLEQDRDPTTGGGTAQQQQQGQHVPEAATAPAVGATATGGTMSGLFRAVASAAATASAAAVRAAPAVIGTTAAGALIAAPTEPLTPPVVKQLILQYPVSGLLVEDPAFYLNGIYPLRP